MNRRMQIKQAIGGPRGGRPTSKGMSGRRAAIKSNIRAQRHVRGKGKPQFIPMAPAKGERPKYLR